MNIPKINFSDDGGDMDGCHPYYKKVRFLPFSEEKLKY